MAVISSYPGIAHFRADPNEFALRYRRGRLVRSGIGLSFWFNRLTAAVAVVPSQDAQIPVHGKVRTADLQDLFYEGVAIVRIADPLALAQRLNFSINLRTARHLDQPMVALANLISQVVANAVTGLVGRAALHEIMRGGAADLARQTAAAADVLGTVGELGLEMASLSLSTIKPSAEVEKALQTPTREAIQQRADQAVFERRAIAVEKERAIAENELATKIEIARREADLIGQRGDNDTKTVTLEAAAARIRADGAAEQRMIAERADASAVRLRGTAEADRFTAVATAKQAAESERFAALAALPDGTRQMLVLERFAEQIPSIQQLSVTTGEVQALVERLVASFARPGVEG